MKRRLAILAVGGLSGVLGLWALWSVRQEPLLLSRSRKLLDVSVLAAQHRAGRSPAGHGRSGGCSGIVQLSSQSYLVLWDEGSQSGPVGHTGQFRMYADSSRAYRLDPHAMRETQVTAVSDAFFNMTWVDPFTLLGQEAGPVSPDGKSIVTPHYSLADGIESFVLNSLTSTRTIAYPRWRDAGRRQVAWLPDSSGWVDVGNDDIGGAMRRYDLTHREPAEMVHVPTIGVHRYVVGMTSDRRVLLKSARNGCYIDLWSIRMETDAHAEHVGRANTPDLSPTYARLSARGDRIVWLMVPDHSSKHSGLTESLLRWLRFGRKPVRGGALWVSHEDGSHMHCVGMLEPEADRTLPLPRMVMWAPDGRHVRYTYRNALYEVPVD